MKHFILLALVLVVLVGCTQDLGAIDLGSANNGTTLDVSSNQVLNVKLDSNATTGYKWNLVTPPDERILKLLSSKYNAPTGGALGAGGSETWQFQAVGRGKATLKLAYSRPFEPNNPPAKEFSITVNVK
jgi:inhibitor of cysteine peptidase